MSPPTLVPLIMLFDTETLRVSSRTSSPDTKTPLVVAVRPISEIELFEMLILLDLPPNVQWIPVLFEAVEFILMTLPVIDPLVICASLEEPSTRIPLIDVSEVITMLLEIDQVSKPAPPPITWILARRREPGPPTN